LYASLIIAAAVGLSRHAKLGPYEIDELAGAGGMGEVYKARDTRLNRTVAVKVLAAAAAADPLFRDRFNREARTISSLDHPYICPIYDIGEHDGVSFLVMPYIDGETLARRIERGPLTASEALSIALQIADALEAAHARGIVHRDLKPANIRITPGGSIKVLDFGLAKDVSVSSGAQSLSPTLSMHATETGVILGTAAYMSPEQARGDPVDRRTDVWAFGCVLFEMITGRSAFGGSTLTDTLAAIIRAEPDWTLMPRDVPAGVVRVIRRCLSKPSRLRFRDIGDVRLVLEDVVLEPSVADAPPSRGRNRLVAAAMSALSFVAGAAVVYLAPVARRAPPEVGNAAVTRLALPLGERERLAESRDVPLGVARPSVAVSADGSSIAYAAFREGATRIYVRRMDEDAARPLRGTDGGSNPFFSPDGTWVGFVADTKLKKVSLLGGDPLVVCDARNVYGATWGDDGHIVLGDAEASRLARVSADGGTPQAITPAGAPNSYTWPQVLPGGKGALVMRDAGVLGTERWRVAWVSLERGNAVDLFDGVSPQYLESGHIVFTRGATLMAATFDPATHAAGAPLPLVEGIRRETFASQFAVGGATLIYAPGGESRASTPVWVDRRGGVSPTSLPRALYGTLRIADGRLAYQTLNETSDVWVHDFRRGTSTRVTTSANNGIPIWTRDGKRLTFASDSAGQVHLVTQPADGSTGAEAMGRSPIVGAPEDWAPDGRALIFSSYGAGTGSDLRLLQPDGSSKPFLDSAFMEWAARYSPDGRWIAYTSDESGRYEVYVRAAATGGDKHQVSSGGGEEPVWDPRGRELSYRNGQRWMSVKVTTDPEFVADPPRLLFEGPYLNVPGFSYDISADGERFLVLKGDEQPPVDALRVVVNVPAEIRKRLSRP
jgi:Tol biopolymer transport system component